MEIKNTAVGFFPMFWYSKKGICDAFCNAFATRPDFPWELLPTCPTLLTVLTLTLTPHSFRTQLHHHLVALGSVGFTTYTFRTDIAIC